MLTYFNEGAKLGLVLGVVAAALYAPWWAPIASRAMVGPVTSQVSLMYHGDAIDTFDRLGECAEVLPVGPAWRCVVE